MKVNHLMSNGNLSSPQVSVPVAGVARMGKEVSTVPQPRPGELTAHRPALPALTGIRFFAAMYVVFYHSHLPAKLTELHLMAGAAMIRNGLLAVPLFFILSGFILSYTYEGQIEQRGAPKRFWEARFARIWPLYAVSLVLSSLINHTTPHSWSTVIATLFMVQAWNPFNMGMAGSWNFVCWTLSTEAFFYLLFPLIQLWLERRRVWVIWLVSILAVAIGVGFATGSINYEDTRGLHSIPLALVHVPEFLVGVCAGNLFLRLRTHQASGESSWTSSPGGIATYVAAVASIWCLCQPSPYLAAGTTLTFGVLLFCLAAERSLLQKFLSTRLLIIAGQISYGIYLLQWPCKAAVNDICGWLHIESIPVRFYADCVVLILLSTATFYGIEEPSRRAIRSLFARRSPRMATAGSRV